jgi:hypothetical protein
MQAMVLSPFVAASYAKGRSSGRLLFFFGTVQAACFILRHESMYFLYGMIDADPKASMPSSEGLAWIPDPSQ